MSMTTEVQGKRIVYFVHLLKAYVLCSDDKEEQFVFTKLESEILGNIRDDLGKEIKGIVFVCPIERR